jgi:voltage-gated potassium channel
MRGLRKIPQNSLDGFYTRVRNKTRAFIESPPVETVIVLLILSSVILMVWSVAARPDWETLQQVTNIENFITYIFVVELLIRFWVARRKRSFFRNYWVDIISVLPALRMFRTFRVLKLLRILRVLRLFRAGLILSRRLSDASSMFSKGLAHYFLMSVMVLLVVLFAALALHHFEGKARNPQAFHVAAALGGPGGMAIANEVLPHDQDELEFEEAFWWAIFTVVAGEPIDYSAKTTGGRVVTFIVMFSGLTVFAFITGVVSAFMVERLRVGLHKPEVFPEDLEGHFICLGWNSRVPFIIEEIQAEPQHKGRFCIVLADREWPEANEWQKVDKNFVHFIQGDPINPVELEKLNIPKSFSVVILADTCKSMNDTDRDARTVLCALMVEKIYPDVFTCAELINRNHASHLQLAGVEEVVIANESSAAVLAMATLHLDMTKILAELLSFKKGNQFYKVEIPDNWNERKFIEVVAEVKTNFNALVIGICPNSRPWNPKTRGVKESQEIMINPPSNICLEVGDQLLVIAQSKIQLS